MPSSRGGLLRTALMVIPPSCVALGLYYQAKNTAHEHMLQMYLECSTPPPEPLDTFYAQFMLRLDMIQELKGTLRSLLSRDYLFDPNTSMTQRKDVPDNQIILRNYTDTLHKASILFEPSLAQDKNAFLKHWNETFSLLFDDSKNNNTKNNKNVLDVLIEKVAPKLKRDLEIDIRTYQRNPSGINLFKAKAKPLTPQSLIELLRDLGFVNTSRRTVNEIVEKNDIHIVAVLHHILSKIPAKSI